MRFSRHTFSAGLVIALVTLTTWSPRAVHAQTFTWNNGTGNWNDATQWVGNVGPVGTSTYGADTLVFGSAGAAYTASNNFTDGDVSRPPFFMINQLNLASSVAGATIDGGTYPNPVRLAFAGPSPAINMTGTGGFALVHPINVFFGDTIDINVAPGAGQFQIGPAPGTTTNSAFYGTGTIRITNNSDNTALLGNIGSFTGTLDIQGTGTVQLSNTTGSWIQPAAIVNIGAGATLNLNNNDDQMGGLTGAGNLQLGTAYVRFNQIRDLDWSGTISNTPGAHGVNPTQPTIHKWFGSRDSVLTWRGNNTYTGETDIRAGALRLVDGGRISGTSDTPNGVPFNGDVDSDAVVVYHSELVLDNTGTANNSDRVNDTANIRLAGTISLLGRAGIASTETLSNVTLGTPPGVPEQGVTSVLAAGPSTINVVNGAGGTATLTLASLTRVGTAGVTLNFAGNGTVNVTAAPPLTNGMLGGFGTYGNEWATMSGNTVVPLASYETSTDPADWAATENVKITAAPSTSIAASQTINSLNFASNQTVTVDAAQVLTLSSGGILASSSGTITGGTLAAGTDGGGARDVKVHVPNAGATVTIDSLIANTGGNTSFTKTGPGTVRLTNTGNTFGSAPNGLGNGVNFQGGFIEISDPAQLGLSTSQLTFSGGGLRLLADLSITGRAISSADVRGMIVDTNGFNLSTAGQSVGGYGGVVKRGLGTWTINEGNSFDGDLWVEQGKVVASGTAGSTFDGTTILHVSAGAEFDFADNIEDFGGIEGDGMITTGVAPGTLLQLAATVTEDPIVTFNGIIQGAGSIGIVTWPFKQSFGGQSTYTGTTAITTGGLIVTANVMPNQDGPAGNASTEIQLGAPAAGAASDIWTSLEIGTAGVEVGRNILVEAETDSILGGVHTTGTSTFSGTVSLLKTLHVQALGTSTVAMTGNIVDFDSGLGEVGGLIKIGSGAVALSGANTYSGGTYVAAGKLLVNGTNSGTGAVTVASDGTLSGTGTIAGPVTVFGTLAPGASVGTLSVSNNVAIDGTLSVEVSGTSIDLLAVTGSLTLGAGSVLDIQGNLATAVAHVIASYNAGSLTGTFGNAADATSNGYNVVYENDRIILDELDGDANHDGIVDIFDVNQVSANWNPTGPVAAFAPGNVNHDTVVDIFDINFISSNWFHVTTNGGPAHAQAVPEPSTLVIALLGLTGIVGFRRFRRMRHGSTDRHRATTKPSRRWDQPGHSLVSA